MGSLIDSSVIVAADRGHLDWQKVVADLSSEPTAISAITAAELLQGVERADPKHRPRREKFVEEVLAATPPADEAAAPPAPDAVSLPDELEHALVAAARQSAAATGAIARMRTRFMN